MESTPKPPRAGIGLRAFTKPTLRVYGTVGEITGAFDVGGPVDGAGHPKNNMTRPPGPPPIVPPPVGRG